MNKLHKFIIVYKINKNVYFDNYIPNTIITIEYLYNVHRFFDFLVNKFK